MSAGSGKTVKQFAVSLSDLKTAIDAPRQELTLHTVFRGKCQLVFAKVLTDSLEILDWFKSAQYAGYTQPFSSTSQTNHQRLLSKAVINPASSDWYRVVFYPSLEAKSVVD